MEACLEAVEASIASVEASSIASVEVSMEAGGSFHCFCGSFLPSLPWKLPWKRVGASVETSMSFHGKKKIVQETGFAQQGRVDHFSRVGSDHQCEPGPTPCMFRKKLLTQPYSTRETYPTPPDPTLLDP